MKLETMMQEAASHGELVSALADGQLRGEEFARTVESVEAAQEARLTWHVYHLVGDVMRSGDALSSARDAAFVQRLKLALQQETPPMPKTSAPDAVAANTGRPVAAGVEAGQDRAANSAHFDWKLLAGVASLALVSVIGWQAWSGSDPQHTLPQLAQAPLPALTPGVAVAASGAEPQLMLRDPQLDALLAAHKQLGGTSALQLPTGFLRNATFEGAGR